MALVTPGIHDEEDEDHETQNEKNERSRLILPELLDAVRKVVRLHVQVIYTSAARY